MKILNLYAGVGGNRRLWGDKHEITAVEWNKSVADCYKDLYPNDTVIVGDAHQYLLDHYHEFDFIWASPPCQSHSRVRQVVAVGYHDENKSIHNTTHPVYPDMKLWQEIVFLKHYCKKDWVIENVIPYYKPFIQPAFTLGSHHYWSNKMIWDCGADKYRAHNASIAELQERKQIDLSKYKFEGIDKRQVLRNMVEPEDGKYIFEQITGEKL